MRDLAQDINLNYIEMVSPRSGWMWDLGRADCAREGNTFLWFIFNGRLEAEYSSQRWDIPSKHIFEVSCFDEPVFLTCGVPQAELALVSYQHRRAGTRQSNRFLTTADPVFTKTLVERTYQRYLKRQLAEANAVLAVLLDELVLGGAVLEAQNDSKLAHQLTQNKLKNIDWSRTQRITPSQ